VPLYRRDASPSGTDGGLGSYAPGRSNPAAIVALVGITVVAMATSAWLLASDVGAADDADATDSTPAEASVALAVPSAAVLAPGLDDRAMMARLSLARRHALLDGAEGVDRSLHAGLDLLQASQSPTPCTLFAQALQTLASTPGDHAWAVTEARPPARPGPDESANACDGLGTRLAALATQPEPEPAAPEPAAEPTPRPAKPRPSNPSHSKKSEKTASKPPTNDPPEDPKKKKKKRPSIATKLDEDLREMGK
jgi:hypothetical protein